MWVWGFRFLEMSDRECQSFISTCLSTNVIFLCPGRSWSFLSICACFVWGLFVYVYESERERKKERKKERRVGVL